MWTPWGTAGSLRLRDVPSSRQKTIQQSGMGDDRSVGESSFLHLRQELHDVAPIPPRHDKVPIVEIDYTDEAREVLSYLRAFVAMGEKSERALAVTGQVRDVPHGPNFHVCKMARVIWAELIGHRYRLFPCWVLHKVQHKETVVDRARNRSKRCSVAGAQAIEMNASDYTAWEFRWQCLEALGTEELFHNEVKYLEAIAKETSKNYQLWNHRRKLALRRGSEHAEEVCIVHVSESYEDLFCCVGFV